MVCLVPGERAPRMPPAFRLDPRVSVFKFQIVPATVRVPRLAGDAPLKLQALVGRVADYHWRVVVVYVYHHVDALPIAAVVAADAQHRIGLERVEAPVLDGDGFSLRQVIP